MEFFAYHGFHPEEQKLGNTFRISLELTADVSTASTQDKLEGTIDYEKVYALVSNNMQPPVKLLEHLGEKIAGQLFDSFLALNELEIHIEKLNPPLGGLCDTAGVRLHYSR